MAITNDQRRLLALSAIRVDHESVDWSLIAREAQFPEGLDALWGGSLQEKSAAAERSRPVLKAGIRRPDDLFATPTIPAGSGTCNSIHRRVWPTTSMTNGRWRLRNMTGSARCAISFR